MTESLIHACVISPDEGINKLDMDGVRRWTPEQGPMWAHFQVDADETRQWLQHESNLPSLIPDVLLAEETRPRVDCAGDGVLLVLRGVNLNPGADEEDMVSVRMWVDQNRLISTRRRRVLSVEDAVASLEATPVSGTADLLLRIAHRLTIRMGDVIDDLEGRIADLEQDVMDEPSQASRSRLSELRRQAIGLRRYMAPQREALGRLLIEPPAWFTALDRVHLREINDRLVRLIEDLDAVRERCSVVHEELISLLSDQLNQRMYLLSIVAALFLPLGFLTGLLGINVGGIPGAEHSHAFWVFSGMLVVIVAAQIAFFFRKSWF